MIERFCMGFLALLVLPMLYALLIVAPVSMYTEAECLRAGYPKHSVTVGLERYCMTLDGAVTVTVKKASEAKK